MSLTLPQILMHNTAAEVNRKRSDEFYERKKKREEEDKQKDERDPIIPEYGKRFSELNTDQMSAYNRRKMMEMMRA
jgi:hypothetical protein